MKKRDTAAVLIHIGFHKTGSTWLQNKVFVESSDVFEPIMRTARGHSMFAHSFIYNSEGYLLNPFSLNENYIQREWRKVIESSSGKKIKVISHERLSGNPHSSGFDAHRISERIHASLPESKIFIVIREQKSFLLSNYFQYLSIGGGLSIKKYLNTKYDGKRPLFSPDYISYIDICSQYIRLFGRSNVLILPYEMLSENGDDFIAKLSKFVGSSISVTKDSLAEKINSKNNRSVMYYFRCLAIFYKSSSVIDTPILNKGLISSILIALIKLLSLIPSKSIDKRVKLKVVSEIDHWVGTRYEESNKKLSKLIGLDLSKWGYHS